MTRPPRDYSGIAVTVPVSVGYSRTSRRTMPWFLGRALSELISRSGIAKSDIDGLAVSSYLLAPDNGASLTDMFGLSPRFLIDFPYGGACGVIAIKRAARAVQNGDAEIVACLAGDIAQHGYGFNAAFSTFSRDHVYPNGGGGMNAVFALITSHYMNAFGAKREDFGRICVAQRANSTGHPMALFRQPLTIETYLNARLICEPLGLFDCVTRVSGAEGFLVMTEDRARSLRLPYVLISGAVERHNGYAGDPVISHFGVAAECDDLYRQAGVGPEAMAFVEAYDDYPVMVMLELEALGFSRPGEAVSLVREKNLTLDGEVPVNTSGGMLSLGQAGAGAGLLHINEAIGQLTGRPMGRAVSNPEYGLVTCLGTVNYDRGICTGAVILRKGGAA
jgi:acetyl-CoA acetyltransferase